MSENDNIIYVSLDENNLATGMTESYTLPEGNKVSLGRITWDEVDFTIMGKKFVDGEWLSVPGSTLTENEDSLRPPKPDDENDYVWSEEKQEWITLEEFEQILDIEE
jgi:hypothetical protein